MADSGGLRNAKVDRDRYWSDHLGVPQYEDRIDVLHYIVDDAEYHIEELQAEERRGAPPQDKSDWLLTSAEKGKSRAREESPEKRIVPLVVMPPQPAKWATAREELLPYNKTPPAGEASSGLWMVKGLYAVDWSSSDDDYGNTEPPNPSRFSTNMVGDWLIICEQGQKDAPNWEYLFSGQERDAAMVSIRRGLPPLTTADHNAGHRVFNTSAAMQKFLSCTAKEKQVNEVHRYLAAANTACCHGFETQIQCDALSAQWWPPAWYREKHPATQTGASAHGSGPSTGHGYRQPFTENPGPTQPRLSDSPQKWVRWMTHFRRTRPGVPLLGGTAPDLHMVRGPLTVMRLAPLMKGDRANTEAHQDMVIRAICLVLTVPGLYRDCVERAPLPIVRLRTNNPISGDLNRGFTQKNAIRHMALNGLTVQEANDAYVFADSWLIDQANQMGLDELTRATIDHARSCGAGIPTPPSLEESFPVLRRPLWLGTTPSSSERQKIPQLRDRCQVRDSGGPELAPEIATSISEETENKEFERKGLRAEVVSGDRSTWRNRG
ncbi:hypothetical protein BV22DRAFT_1051640 [Leucogyrophana mollusca]|uniref:Uncharacterized protein n=1 Tax=Leucogyrophana mollusca TaxID=85980 RepID=A0ACB8B0E5_9AGAM|nr:hypothetical protein BV22DRAFT_1051640 [Leucogyrophana mollusca]